MWQKTWKCHKSSGRTCVENVSYVCVTESDIISLTVVTRRQVLWHRKRSARRMRKSRVRPWVASNGRKFLGHFICHFRSQISSDSSKQGHMKRINPKFTTETRFLSYLYPQVECASMFLSDFWSRSSFWVTVRASRVLMSAKQSIVYWGLAHLQTETKLLLLLQMLASLARIYDPVWVILMIFVAQNGV